MKIVFFYGLFIFFCLASCTNNKPKTFTLEGEINGLADSTALVLSYLKPINDKWVEVSDTAYILNKKFTFKGEINELTAAFLGFNNNFIRFYMEPTTMKLQLTNDRPWEYELSGTKVEEENKVLRERIKSYEEELYKELLNVQNIVEQINIPDIKASERDSLMKNIAINAVKREAIGKQIDKIKLNYILENNKSKIAPDLIYTMAKWESVDIDTLRNTYNSLSDEIKMTLLGKLANKQLEQTEQLINGKDITVGSPAPQFSGTDISGKEIKLTELNKQNFILLDFWASWCKPCLAQVGQLQKIHKSYADKGLTIIGISTDENKEHWRNAVEKYKLGNWYQILSKPDSDNDYFARDISDSYGVESIPTYFLINKQGKIIARWQHIEDDELAFIDKVVNEK